MFHQPFRLFFLLGLTAFALACGADEEAPQPAAVISAFEVSPPTIDPGMTATLHWDVRGAVRLRLQTEDGAPVELDAQALEAHEVDVQPTESTAYVLEAWGKDGNVVEREARVAVRRSSLRILEFVASAESVEAEQGVRLSWATENATDVRLFTKGGAEIPVGDAAPEAGAVDVAPVRTTTYVLRASNAEAVDEAQVTVEVKGGLDAELFAARQRIEHGEETQLQWRVQSANRIVIRAGSDVLLDGDEGRQGTLAVAPAVTTTYVLTAHGFEGVREATAVVKVSPRIDRFSVVTEGAVPRGGDVELTWSVGGADALRIFTPGGFEHVVEAEDLEEGSAIVPAPAGGVLHLEASSGEEKTLRTVTVELLERPTVLAFSVDPTILTVADGDSEEITFSWEATSPSTVVIRDEDGVVVVEGGATGAAPIRISEGGVFTLTAGNAAGSVSRSVQVQTFAPPTIDDFSVWPTHVGAGEPFTLRWEASGSQVALERDGALIHSGPGGAGSRAAMIGADATYRLLVANEAGAEVERELSVTVGPPAVLSFVADSSRLGPGSSLRLSWANRGGTKVEVSGPGGLACTTEEPADLAAGACTTNVPSSPGLYTYSLILENGIGQRDTEIVQIEVVDGPAILTFFADKSRYTVGDDVTFTWTAGVDANEEVPELELRDGATVYALGGADALSGSATVQPQGIGARTFRLTASTPGSTPSSRELVLVGFALPTLDVQGPANGYLPGTGTVELSWTGADAERVEVFEVDDQGAASSYGIFYDPALIAAGAVQVAPPAPGRTYRFVATNAAGGTVTRELYVGWDDPIIDAYSAWPEDSSLRQPISLQWLTTGATSVSFEPLPLVEVEPFVDVGERSTATELVLGDCGAATLPTDGCADVTLPFPFPYDGQTVSAVRIFQNGVISFDPTHQGGALPAVALPSTQDAYVALAPFWQQLLASVPGAAREGRILMDEGTDLHGGYVVFQWEGFWAPGATVAEPVDLNFQVLLYQNGDFDFRYGRMEGAERLEWVDGRQASIGYQSQGGAAGRSIAFEEEVSWGLGDLAFGIRPAALPPEGSIDVISLAVGPATYTLHASHEAGSSSATDTVTVFEGVNLAEVSVAEAFAVAGSPFTVQWLAENAAEVRVELPMLDPEDPEEMPVVLCTVLPADPQQCALMEASPGTYTYVVRGVGQGAQDEVTEEIEVEVFPPFGIESFSATTEDDDLEVTLSWETLNATTLTLTADGVSLNIPSQDIALGSLTHTITETTTFVLTATSHGREATETRTVVVDEDDTDDP